MRRSVGCGFMRAPRSISLRCLAAAGLVALLVACEPYPRVTGARAPASRTAPAFSRHHNGEPLLILGDSLTVGARDYGELGARLTEDGWVPEIVAEKGQVVDWATQQVLARDEVPRDVVIALGSNPASDPSGFEDDVDALLDALRQRGARAMLWVPPYGTDPERYTARQEVLRGFADRARITLSAWPQTLASHPEYFTGDGLHLTGDGYAAMATFIRDELS
jgi:lysophospholipase L1-like esterase